MAVKCVSNNCQNKSGWWRCLWTRNANAEKPSKGFSSHPVSKTPTNRPRSKSLWNMTFACLTREGTLENLVGTLQIVTKQASNGSPPSRVLPIAPRTLHDYQFQKMLDFGPNAKKCGMANWDFGCEWVSTVQLPPSPLQKSEFLFLCDFKTFCELTKKKKKEIVFCGQNYQIFYGKMKAKWAWRGASERDRGTVPTKSGQSNVANCVRGVLRSH